QDQPDTVFFVDRAIALCGGKRGWLLRYSDTKGKRSIVQTDVLGLSGRRVFTADYSRLSSSADSDAALAAVMSLCPPVEKSKARIPSEPAPLVAPSGWDEVPIDPLPSPMGQWLWSEPGGGAAKILLIASMNVQSIPTNNYLVEESRRALEQVTSAPVTLVNVRKVPLCHARTGSFAHMTSSSAGSPVAFDVVIYADAKLRYIATYMRLASQPDLAEAVQSLESLCP
ncbi:MAG TPA: hypothetical protein VK760_06670, partial [Candidatus Acidoferrales bacterium]|nr:hypothetical protein [Candidatus Acidoferrales bacterium]